MGFFDRVLFQDSRAWVCSRASGDTLEVGIGTGLNLPFYPANVRLTGIDFSQAMLSGARTRARGRAQPVELEQADAEALPFPNASFDTVVSTFALCAIPDDRRALAEMQRVLRPGGLLLLADHIAGRYAAVRAIQRVLEVFSIPVAGEHFLRRPFNFVRADGFEIERQQRFNLGIVERIAARKPASPAAS